MFNITGIKGRLQNGDDDVRSAMATKTDFAAAHKKISALRIKSYEYLYRALLDKGDTDL